MTPFSGLIKGLVDGRAPDAGQMREAMQVIIGGDADPVAVGAFLVALQMHGEDYATLSAAAGTLLDAAVPLELDDANSIDTCGTGGDGSSSFNVSTATAVVAAAAGAVVAKHGNRAVSGNCGSADLLDAAGVVTALDAAGVACTLKRTGIGFIFAPLFHPALAQVAPVRKALGVRTIFNLLGPLVNPARPPCRIIGVFDRVWLEPMARAAVALGARHVITVHSEDGMDEISVAAPTHVYEIDAARDVRKAFSISPGEFGIATAEPGALRVADAAESLAVLQAVLAAEPGAARDAVVLNAGAALYAAAVAGDMKQGVALAQAAIDDGRALQKFEQWIAASEECRREAERAG